MPKVVCDMIIFWWGFEHGVLGACKSLWTQMIGQGVGWGLTQLSPKISHTRRWLHGSKNVGAKSMKCHLWHANNFGWRAFSLDKITRGVWLVDILPCDDFTWFWGHPKCVSTGGNISGILRSAVDVVDRWRIWSFHFRGSWSWHDGHLLVFGECRRGRCRGK